MKINTRKHRCYDIQISAIITINRIRPFWLIWTLIFSITINVSVFVFLSNAFIIYRINLYISVKEEIIPYTPKQNPNPSSPDRFAPRESLGTCKCFICGKYLSNQYNLRVHMETHQEAFHACQSCPHISRSRDALRKHVSYRHPDECRARKRKKQWLVLFIKITIDPVINWAYQDWTSKDNYIMYRENRCF